MIRVPAAFLLGLALTSAVHAAAPGCAVPPNLAEPHIELPAPDQPPRVVPVVSYTLALIWTPQHCHRTVAGAEALTCGRDVGSRFVLHGLWPDGEGKSWPQWCAATGILPRKTIAAHYCATPSPQLLQHEWAKHGTCIAGATPDSYFGQSNRLFRDLRFPDMTALASAGLTQARFADAFVQANPGMTAESLRLNLDREGWLQEVWLCLDTEFRPSRCAQPDPTTRIVRIRL